MSESEDGHGDLRMAIMAVAILLVVAAGAAVLYFSRAQGEELSASGISSEADGKNSDSLKSERSHSGTLLPKGCVSYPCGYYRGRLTSGIAEVVQCPLGVEPPAYMDFQACRRHLWPGKEAEY